LEKRAIAIFSNNALLEKTLYSDKINFPQDKCLPGDEDGVCQTLFVLEFVRVCVEQTFIIRPLPGRTLKDDRRRRNKFIHF